MSKQIGGNLPLTFNSNKEENLKNYRIYGTAEGVGEEVVMIISQTTIEDASERQLRLRVTATTNDQSIIISTTGIIACRGESVPEAGLTIESAAASSNIVDISLDGTSVSTTATDTKGGVHYRGYCVLSDGTVLYNDIISTTLEQEQQQLSSDSVTHYKIPFLCSHKNLVAGTISNASVNSSGVVVTNSTFDLAITPIESGKSYSIKFSYPEGSTSKVFCGIFSSYPDIGSSTYNNTRFTFASDYYTFTAPISGYLASTFILPTDAVVFEGSVPYQSNYDLFIGSSQLVEDEYLDYESGKMYKKKPNLVSDIIDNAYVNSSGVFTTNSSLNAAITLIEKNKMYTVLKARTGGNIFCGFFETYPAMGASTYDSSRLIFGTEYYTFIAPITGYLVSSCSPNENDPIVYEGEYPQIVPTDPPVPLPTIQSYQGENILSSTEDIEMMVIDYGNDNIAIINIDNTSYNIIDENFYSIVADNYNNQQSYSEGDYCIYNYQLYKCNANTSGNWDASKWTLTNLTEWLRGD